MHFTRPGEEIDVTEEGGEGDGWIRGRNLDGGEGLMPENYIGTQEDYEVKACVCVCVCVCVNLCVCACV